MLRLLPELQVVHKFILNVSLAALQLEECGEAGEIPGEDSEVGAFSPPQTLSMIAIVRPSALVACMTRVTVTVLPGLPTPLQATGPSVTQWPFATLKGCFRIGIVTLACWIHNKSCQAVPSLLSEALPHGPVRMSLTGVVVQTLPYNSESDSEFTVRDRP